MRKGHFPRDKRVQLIYELAGMGLPGWGLNMTCQKTYACIYEFAILAACRDEVQDDCDDESSLDLSDSEDATWSEETT